MTAPDLWSQRSVGIKLWGLAQDPHGIALTFPSLSEANAKGDAHGRHQFFQEHQLHLLKLMTEDDEWDDVLHDFVTELGGAKQLLQRIQALDPKRYWVVINIPTSDAWCGNGHRLSRHTLALLNDLNTDLSINYF